MTSAGTSAAMSAATRPRVSVVIPVLDDATELAICLDLLARQDVAPYEVVVVDNGSSDDSVALAQAAGARVVHEPRRGIPHAAATGCDAATGDVIARIDADSRPRPDWVGRVGDHFAENPTLAGVTGWGWFHDLPVVLRHVATVFYLGSYYLLTWLAGARLPLWGSSMAVRRSAWESASPRVHRDLDVHDDMDLTFVLGPTATIRLDPGLRADVSGRSLRGAAQRRRRMQRAVTTLRANWAVSPPWERWQQRFGRSSTTGQ